MLSGDRPVKTKDGNDKMARTKGDSWKKMKGPVREELKSKYAKRWSALGLRELSLHPKHKKSGHNGILASLGKIKSVLYMSLWTSGM